MTKQFDPNSIDLPIVEIISEVQTHLAKKNSLVVNAPPGAGKSTLLPLPYSMLLGLTEKRF